MQFVHIASVWVPFTSESKEAIASYDEIMDELKKALMECGRKLGLFVRKGKKLADAVDALCEEHLSAITKSLGTKGKLAKLTAGEWSGRLVRVLAEFEGVPALVAFEKQNKKALESLRDGARAALKDWWKEKDGDPAKAFTAGLDLIEEGFLDYRCVEVRAQLETWAKDAKGNDLSKRDVQRWEELGDVWAKAREEGFREFERENLKTKL